MRKRRKKKEREEREEERKKREDGCLPSRTGFELRSWSLTLSTLSLLTLTAAMYFMMTLEASVLPAPLSPVIRMHWFTFLSRMDLYAASAIANLLAKKEEGREKRSGDKERLGVIS